MIMDQPPRREKPSASQIAPEQEQGRQQAAPSRRGFEWTPRRIIWAVVLVLVAVFILQNFDDAPINILFWEVTPPLSGTLLAVGIAGYVLGWLRPHFRARRS